MGVIRNNKFCVSSDSAIYEFVVINIFFYQTKVDVNFLIYCCMQSSNGFNDIMRYLPCRFLRKDFFVFIQDLGIHTKANTARQNIAPYLVIWALRRQRLKQAIGVKNDSPHNDKEYACVPRPTAL